MQAGQLSSGPKQSGLRNLVPGHNGCGGANARSADLAVGLKRWHPRCPYHIGTRTSCQLGATGSKGEVPGSCWIKSVMPSAPKVAPMQPMSMRVAAKMPCPGMGKPTKGGLKGAGCTLRRSSGSQYPDMMCVPTPRAPPQAPQQSALLKQPFLPPRSAGWGYDRLPVRGPKQARYLHRLRWHGGSRALGGATAADQGDPDGRVPSHAAGNWQWAPGGDGAMPSPQALAARSRSSRAW